MVCLKNFAVKFLIVAALAAAFPMLGHAQTFQTTCPQGSSVNSWGSARNGSTGAILQNYCTDGNGNAILNFPVPAGVFGQSFIVGTFPGTDTGQQINACDAQITALGLFGGNCVLSGNLQPTGAPEIITPVSMANETVLSGCAVTILVDVTIPLNVQAQSVWGCPGRSLVFTKNANVDAFKISAFYNEILSVDIEGGGKTGCGIKIDNSAFGEGEAVIADNFTEQNGTELCGVGGQYDTVQNNEFAGFSVSALDFNGESYAVIGPSNYIHGFGTETGDTIKVYGSNCFVTITANKWIQNRTGHDAINASACTNAKIIGNPFISSTGTGIAWAGGSGEITGNQVGGVPALSTTGGGGPIMNNFFSTNNSTGTDAVVLSGFNQGEFGFNEMTVNDSLGGACGVKITGDTIGLHLQNNQAIIGPGTAADYGGCILTTSGHMLGIRVDNFFGGGVGAPTGSAAFYVNNAGGLNTNWDVQVVGLGCVHLTDLLKRTDAQNNLSQYDQLSPGDCTLDAGTGSNKDQFTISSTTFAALPTPAGNGSVIKNCSNCTQAKPTASGGGGAYVVREAGAWNGL